LPHARETVTALAADHRVVLITKGDLLDQERKLAQSGLGDLFHGVEIVSDKTAAMYQAAFARHGAGPQNAAMVGNSLKSDVLPALAVGAWGIHVPHDLTWSYEQAEPPIDAPRFRAISDLGALPILIAELKNTP
jgi:putative hydrolase of the HAD superfamily